jgi:Xaa-Pro aminopeptidase
MVPSPVRRPRGRRPACAGLLAVLGWVLATPAAARGQITQGEYAARRAALVATIDSGVIVVPGGREPVVHYPRFSQRPAIRYLTGFLAPDATLLLVKHDSTVGSTLFIQPPNARREFYTGARDTPADVERETDGGLRARPNADLDAVLDSLVRAGLPLSAVSDAESDEFVAGDSLSFGRALVRRVLAAHPGLTVSDATHALDSLRAKKSPAELALLKQAAAISVFGHRAAMLAVAPGLNEGEIQGLMEYTFKQHGGDRPAYASIVGSGPNSTILHYDRDDRVMRAGDVVVLDVASDYQGYAADITRTLPVSGVFTADQLAVYQIVHDAQAAGERQVHAGVAAEQEVDSIRAVVAAGLVRLKLIDSSAAQIDAPAGFCGGGVTVCPQWALFMPHGPGHGLGLDVHDPAQYYYGPQQFEVGDAFTIEPGIYIRPSTVNVLPDTPRNRAYIERIKPLLDRYANIGVRIEDDYIVTTSGLERISFAPREASEIEQAMQKIH